MIDVSNLPHLQAEIVLIIERQGTKEIRVCNIKKEISGNKNNIERELSKVLRSGIIIKIIGDTVKYYSPELIPAQAQATPAPTGQREVIKMMLDVEGKIGNMLSIWSKAAADAVGISFHGKMPTRKPKQSRLAVPGGKGKNGNKTGFKYRNGFTF